MIPVVDLAGQPLVHRRTDLLGASHRSEPRASEMRWDRVTHRNVERCRLEIASQPAVGRQQTRRRILLGRHRGPQVEVGRCVAGGVSAVGMKIDELHLP